MSADQFSHRESAIIGRCSRIVASGDLVKADNNNQMTVKLAALPSTRSMLDGIDDEMVIDQSCPSLKINGTPTVCIQ